MSQFEQEVMEALGGLSSGQDAIHRDIAAIQQTLEGDDGLKRRLERIETTHHFYHPEGCILIPELNRKVENHIQECLVSLQSTAAKSAVQSGNKTAWAIAIIAGVVSSMCLVAGEIVVHYMK